MTRTKIIAALCTVGLALGAGSAEAKHFHGHGHSHGFGHGRAVLSGLALGAVVVGAAVAATSDETYECIVKVRRTYDGFGNVYVRRVRVCE
ncbi:Transmembrane protein [Methylorubrum aminovorans]|nr:MULTISPECIES: hypothetical protein [unclassified Methylobacterium]QIJ76134.1 hypothetical protein CLZ_16940 [Methylobacterium sp. CLZ]QIJ81037.1 hypothetical protein GU700_16945 [Methylobacterium sp. NI91]